MTMSATTAIPSLSIRGIDLRPRRRPQPSLASLSGSLHSVISKHGYWYSTIPCVQLGRSRCRIRSELHVVMNNNILPGASPPPPPNFPVWVTWVLGSIVTIIIPMLKLKGGFLLNLGKRIDQVVDTVEDVAEAVEDVAEAVENAASEVADHLPEGEIKDAALWVENASKEVREDAEQAKDFIDMVDNLTEEVEENVETIMDSFTDQKKEEALQKEAKMEGQQQKKAKMDVPNQNEAAIDGKNVKVEAAATQGQERKDAGEKATPVRDAAEVRQT